jgi:hypothetical protein
MILLHQSLHEDKINQDLEHPPMTHTVVALFEEYRDATRAVSALRAEGFSDSDISFLTPESAHQMADEGTHGSLRSDNDSPITAGEGAMMGGLTGLVVGAGAALIPGIGPVLAIGPLGMALSAAVGAGMGAVAGPLVDSLVGIGAPQGDAEVYAEALKRGHTVVAVRTGESRIERVEDIFMRQGAEDIEEVAREWRDEGWGAARTHEAPAMNDYLAQPHPVSANPGQRAIPTQEDYIGQGHDVAAAPTGAVSNTQPHASAAREGVEEPIPMTNEERREARDHNTVGRKVRVYGHLSGGVEQLPHPSGIENRTVPEPYDVSPPVPGYAREAVVPGSLPNPPRQPTNDLGQVRERTRLTEEHDVILDEEDAIFTSDLPHNEEEIRQRKKRG